MISAVGEWLTVRSGKEWVLNEESVRLVDFDSMRSCEHQVTT